MTPIIGSYRVVSFRIPLLCSEPLHQPERYTTYLVIATQPGFQTLFYLATSGASDGSTHDGIITLHSYWDDIRAVHLHHGTPHGYNRDHPPPPKLQNALQLKTNRGRRV